MDRHMTSSPLGIRYPSVCACGWYQTDGASSRYWALLAPCLYSKYNQILPVKWHLPEQGMAWKTNFSQHEVTLDQGNSNNRHTCLWNWKVIYGQRLTELNTVHMGYPSRRPHLEVTAQKLKNTRGKRTF